MRQFVWIIAAAAPLFAASQYVEGRVIIEWRRWLAEQLLGAYFSDHAYYRLKLGAFGGAGAGRPSGGEGQLGGGGGESGGGGGVLDNPDQVGRGFRCTTCPACPSTAAAHM